MIILEIQVNRLLFFCSWPQSFLLIIKGQVNYLKTLAEQPEAGSKLCSVFHVAFKAQRKQEERDPRLFLYGFKELKSGSLWHRSPYVKVPRGWKADCEKLLHKVVKMKPGSQQTLHKILGMLESWVICPGELHTGSETSSREKDITVIGRQAGVRGAILVLWH